MVVAGGDGTFSDIINSIDTVQTAITYLPLGTDNATVTIDDHVFEVARLLSIKEVKQPYYGFGMKVVPKARFNDRKLHILSITSGLLKSSIGGVTAFTIGNRIGEYRTGRRVILHLEQPLVLQINGNEAWESETFRFTLLPK